MEWKFDDYIFKFHLMNLWNIFGKAKQRSQLLVVAYKILKSDKCTTGDRKTILGMFILAIDHCSHVSLDVDSRLEAGCGLLEKLFRS